MNLPLRVRTQVGSIYTEWLRMRKSNRKLPSFKWVVLNFFLMSLTILLANISFAFTIAQYERTLTLTLTCILGIDDRMWIDWRRVLRVISVLSRILYGGTILIPDNRSCQFCYVLWNKSHWIKLKEVFCTLLMLWRCLLPWSFVFAQFLNFPEFYAKKNTTARSVFCWE